MTPFTESHCHCNFVNRMKLLQLIQRKLRYICHVLGFAITETKVKTDYLSSIRIKEKSSQQS